MKYIFGSVIERDADYALINALLTNDKVRKLFLDLISRNDGEIEEVYHSLVQKEKGHGVGESDIVFVIKDNLGRFGLMIENKINADTQPNQRERYDIRAKELKKLGIFDKYYVFLCAPQSYLGSMMAKDYERKVPYEKITSLLDEGLDKAILLKSSEGGVTIIKSESVTEFWNKLYKHVHDYYSDLHIVGKLRDRSSKSLWPEFRTVINGCNIVMKTDRGIIDLEFSGMGKRLYELELKLHEMGVSLKPVQAKKSASLRYKFEEKDYLSFNEDFEKQIDTVNKWLDKAMEFNDLTKKLYEKGLKNLK